MDIVLGVIVLAILVALHLFMIVVAHRARMGGAGSAPPEPLVTDDRTKAVWESGG
jgi:hypothetical protein